jgi:hypothetical protein
LKRNVDQHATCTITLYYTVEGGIPTEQDIEAAIADIKDIFQKSDLSGKLSTLAPLGITAPKPKPVSFVLGSGSSEFPMDSP